MSAYSRFSLIAGTCCLLWSSISGAATLPAGFSETRVATGLASPTAMAIAPDGRVFVAVKTTGIYCKPSCPAKRPKREHVQFFSTGDEARAAGYRACLRCKPDEVGRDREAVSRAVKLIEHAEEVPQLGALAAAVGYAPHHFQRIFKRDLGVSPAEYARGLRNLRAQHALKSNDRVTDAVYDAGYSGPSGFYNDAKERLGMTPSAWRSGGRGETIRWTNFDSPLGRMLIAVTSKGICRLTFDDSPDSLRRYFPNADRRLLHRADQQRADPRREREVEQVIDMLAQAVGAQHETAGTEGAFMQAFDRLRVLGGFG